MHNTLSLEKSFRKKILPLLTNKITTIFVSKYLKILLVDFIYLTKILLYLIFFLNNLHQLELIAKENLFLFGLFNVKKVLKKQYKPGLIKFILLIIRQNYMFLELTKCLTGLNPRLSKKNIHFFGRVSKKT